MFNLKNKITVKELLEYSYKENLSHIPSALSMLDYVDELFTNEIVTPNDCIVIGKPFGAQTYYLIWKKLKYLDEVENLSIGVKHDEISFVDYSEETMGNALGVSIGIALVNKNKKVWVNISDATLQMGNTIEAIQFIGHNNIKNIFVTVDYNNSQVTGKIDEILSVHPIIDMCKLYNWHIQEVEGHNRKEILDSYNSISSEKPNIIFLKTIKGSGVISMEKDIKKWHYKKIETLTELQSLVVELQDT
jgi:transketolase N-terminal domain/subunit